MPDLRVRPRRERRKERGHRRVPELERLIEDHQVSAETPARATRPRDEPQSLPVLQLDRFPAALQVDLPAPPADQRVVLNPAFHPPALLRPPLPLLRPLPP